MERVLKHKELQISSLSLTQMKHKITLQGTVFNTFGWLRGRESSRFIGSGFVQIGFWRDAVAFFEDFGKVTSGAYANGIGDFGNV